LDVVMKDFANQKSEVSTTDTDQEEN
jgi:hypothetical protein